MNLHSELERFHKEHDEILRFLQVWEGALNLVARSEDSERCRGLTRLREMEEQVARIEDHCRAEEQSVESPYKLYLEDTELQRLEKEHELLARWSNDFHRELTFATVLRTDEMLRLGRQLLEQLRHHIAFEEGLLKKIEDSRAAEDKMHLRYTQAGE
jgi:hypothetical protein